MDLSCASLITLQLLETVWKLCNKKVFPEPSCPPTPRKLLSANQTVWNHKSTRLAWYGGQGTQAWVSVVSEPEHTCQVFTFTTS